MTNTDPRPHYGRKRIVDDQGYVQIWEPDHPVARKDGYVMEHRKVMFDSGVFLTPDLHVHHINGDKQDNRLANLEVLSNSAHGAIPKKSYRNQHGIWPRRARA